MADNNELVGFRYIGGKWAAEQAATTATFTHGLTILEGDLVTLFLTTNDENASFVSTDGSEWSRAIQEINYPGNETNCVALLWKVATAEEPTSYTFSLPNSTYYSGIVKVFRGYHTPELHLTNLSAVGTGVHAIIHAANGAVVPPNAVSLIYGWKDNRTAGSFGTTAVEDNFTDHLGNTIHQFLGGAHKIVGAGETYASDQNTQITFSTPSPTDAYLSAHVVFVDTPVNRDFAPPTIWTPDRQIKQGNERYYDLNAGPSARRIQDDFPVLDEMTVACWFNGPSTPTVDYGRVFEIGAYDGGSYLPGLSLEWNNLGPNITGIVRSDTLAASFTNWAFPQNVWNHVVMEWDVPGNEANMWQNGAANANNPRTQAFLANITSTVTKFGIAISTDNAPNGSNGTQVKVAHFAIWERHLTSGERALLNAGANPASFPDRLFYYAPDGLHPVINKKNLALKVFGSPLITTDRPYVDPIPRVYRRFNPRTKQVTARKWHSLRRIK